MTDTALRNACIHSTMLVLGGVTGVAAQTSDIDGHLRATSSAPLFDRNPLARAQVRLYGRLALGFVKPDSQQGETARLGSSTRSYLGMETTDRLDSGFLGHVVLEHTVALDRGAAPCDRQPSEPCSTTTGPSSGELGAPEIGRTFWHGRATVGVSEPTLGRIDLGRRDQPAWRVALALDPWYGNTVATPGVRLYAPPPTGNADPGSTRSNNSVTYTSRLGEPWQIELQASSGEGVEAHPTYGASVIHQTGAWYAGLGWQQWSDGSFAVPFGIRRMFEAGSAFGALTLGRVAGRSYQGAFLGASWTFMAGGDPSRHELRTGLALLRAESKSSETKAAVGYRYRLSRLTAVDMNAARVNGDGAGGRTAFDLALVHHFERDLRFPQQGFR